MKKLILYVVPFFILCSCEIDEQTNFNDEISKIEAKAISDPNDPNLDPNWNWEGMPNSANSRVDLDPDEFNQVRIYFPCNTCPNGINSSNVPLPWTITPDNVPNSDYKKEDGWELYMRDFGTENRAPIAPFFALYNKYSGILRFYMFNYLDRDPTGFKGKLQFSSVANSLLAFTAEPENSTLQTATINNHSEEITSTTGPYNSIWVRLDFPIVNYHPMVDENTQFQLIIDQVLEFNGTGELNLNQSQVGGGARSRFSFQDGINTGFSLSKSLADLIDAFTKLQSDDEEEEEINVRKKTYLKDNQNTNSAIDPVSAFKIISSSFGIIKSFFGSSNSPQQLLHFTGFQNINIVSERITPYAISFIPRPNTPINPNFYVPIYPEEIGVFNFNKNPDITVNFTQGLLSERNYIINNFTYTVNQASNLDLISSRIKVWDENVPEGFREEFGEVLQLDWPWPSHWRFFAGNSIEYPTVESFGWSVANTPKFATFEFKFKKRNYEGNFDDEIIFQKMLPLNQIINF